MHIIHCKQGTPEWHMARAGVITASEFANAISTTGGLNEQQQTYVDAVLAGKTETEAMVIAGYKAKPKATGIDRALRGEVVGEPSAGSNRYACDLAIERISGKPYGEPPKAWLLDRGHELEDLARAAYEARGEFVTESGIAMTDDRLFGYSTDGLVEDDGLIEIKCPIDGLKVAMMLSTGDVSEYMHQMQGGMWITGRKWCDFIMYVPDLKRVDNDLYVKRIYRDDNFIEDMVTQLIAFNRRVEHFKLLFSMKEAA